MDARRLTFKPTGDRELWVVSGLDWSIPIFVVPLVGNDGKAVVSIRAAVALSAPQLMALHDRLNLQEYSSPDGAIWFTGSMDDLPALAKPAKGVTPAYYLKWVGSDEPIPASEFTVVTGEGIEKPKLNSDMQHFIKRIWERTSIADIKVLSILYDTICDEAQRWMLEENKVLDLGFVRLSALPYRANWKQILLAKFPKILRFFNMPKDKRDATLALTDFVEEIRSTSMMAVHRRESFFFWTIEATPTKSWVKTCENKERARLQMLTRAQYSRYWARLISRLESTITDTFGEFVHQTAIPCGAVTAGGHQGTQCIGPLIPKGRVRPISADHVETRVAYPDPTLSPHETADREPELVSSEVDMVPPGMPVVSFGNAHVRKGRSFTKR